MMMCLSLLLVHLALLPLPVEGVRVPDVSPKAEMGGPRPGGGDGQAKVTQELDNKCPDCGDDSRMVKLIEELSGDKNLETFAQLQSELLRRVNADKFFGEQNDGALREVLSEYQGKEDSVFDFVEKHKMNEERKMDMYAEQFQKVHGMDHKSFTEKWLLDQTGEEIQLEKVLENPKFHDFVGVYDIYPMTAYVASKLIIDDSDFMGLYDVSGAPAHQMLSTYDDVEPTDLPDTTPVAKQHLQEAKMKQDTVMQEGTKTAATQPCGCSDTKVGPHFLGDGEYLQFRLRNENVRKYFDNSVPAIGLKKLIPDDPTEPIYIFTVSSNGIMRFHPWGGAGRKLFHGYGDSEEPRHFTFPKNIVHAKKYGCFCFGVIYRERENYITRNGTLQKGGRTIVMRYNRWATDNAPVYGMVRQSADEIDASVPAQNSTLKHWYNHTIKRLFHR